MASRTTITILVENSVAHSKLLAEHGLAFWIESGARHILYDTGQSRILTANAQELNLGLSAVDTIVLSHGHYDHCGGLAEVLTNAVGAVAIHAHPDALLPKYRRTPTGVKNIGIPHHCLAALRQHGGFRAVTTPTEIAPGLFMTGEIPRHHPEEDGDSGFRRDADGLQVDPLLDDQTFYIQTPNGTVVLLGCAHAGIINILDHIQRLTQGQPFLAVVGGMHLHSASDSRIAWTLEALRRFSIEKMYPAHCTGMKASVALWTAFSGHCFACGVGTALTV